MTSADLESAYPWKNWFENSTTISTKAGYTYVFWDASRAKEVIAAQSAEKLMVLAAAVLLRQNTVSQTAPDLLKFDAAYVMEHDAYGKPVWSSLKQVGHMELSKKQMIDTLSGASFTYKLLRQSVTIVKLSQ